MAGNIKQRRSQTKLNWSLNISQTDDALYTLPARSSNATLKLAKDQWCKSPTYYLQSQQQNWEKGRTIEVTLFLSSAANNCLELVCHDPLHERTSSYQVEANSEVLKIQILPLPAGVNQKQQRASTTTDDQDMEAFGILLVLATIEGVSTFSMVFTKSINEDSFALEECSELSRNELQDINTPLRGRRVQQIQSKIVAGPISDEDISKKRKKQNIQQTQTYLILAVASSPDTKSGFSQQSTYLHNVDAFLFSLVDHYCPVFRYRKLTKPDSLGMPSLAHFQGLLKGVSRVKSVEFGGTNLLGKDSHSFLAVLLGGELKLVPLPTLARFHDSLNSHRIKVQTVLLSGVCAHPSMSDLGEAVILEPNQRTNNIAVLCRPKIDEIGFKSSPPPGVMLSSRRTVSFSPVEFVNEFTPGSEIPKTELFHQDSCSHPLPDKVGDQQTPKHQRLDDSQVVTPESDNLTPKKSNVSQMSTTSSLLGLKLVNDELSVETDTPQNTQADGVTAKTATNSTNLSIETTESSLVGLDLVTSRSVSGVNEHSLVSPANGDNSQDILDLTGKWRTPRNSDNKLSSLSPLSGINLNSSAEDDFFQNESLVQSAATPRQTPNRLQTGRFAPGSALKTIRCTTPAREVRRASVSASAEQLSHVVVLKVEQMGSHSDGEDNNKILLKVTHLSVALPPNLSSFRIASVTWAPVKPGGLHEILSVATHDPSSDMSKINVAFLALEGSDSLKVTGTTFCDTTALFNSLERTARNKKYVYGIRSIALLDTDEEKRTTEENCNTMEIRLIVSTAVRDVQEKDNRGTIAPKTPINMSLTEDTRVSVASATLPIQSLITGTEGRSADTSAGKKSSPVDGSSHIAAKLDEVMSFLQRFEKHVNTRMDAMDERLGNVEEALRTV